MSEVAAVLGLPASFEFEGRQWRVAPRDFEIEGLFARWLEERALLAIQRHARALGPAAVAAQMDGWRGDCAAGLYDWGMPAAFNAAMCHAGQKELCYLQLAKAQLRGVDRDLVERLFDDDDGWARFKAAQQQADADPNRPRPGRKQAEARPSSS